MEQRLRAMTETQTRLRPVPSLHLRSTMGEAARQMYMGSTDAIVVLDDHGHDTLGLVTARDVIAVVAEGLDPEAVTIGQRLQSPRAAGNSSRPLNDLWFS